MRVCRTYTLLVKVKENTVFLLGKSMILPTYGACGRDWIVALLILSRILEPGRPWPGRRHGR
jgi:hypothetical protein